VLLRFHEDLPVREVARRMGVPYETARARLASAMAKLRRALASEDDGGLRAVAWLGLAAKGAAMGSSKYAVAAVAVLLVAGGGLAVGVTCLSGDGKDAAGGESTTAAVDGDAAPSSKTRVVATQPRGRRHANDGDATRDGAIQLDQEIKVTFEDAAVPTVATKPPFPLPERLNGRIVDDEGGASLDGARVLLFVVLADGKLGRGQGDTTGADGAFKNPRPQGWDAPGAHAELFIAKEGYETVRVPVTESEPVVKMRRMTRAPLPGRVVGVARDEQGLPLTGALLVTSEDEIRNNAAQYVIADAGGAFVLEGVPPGWKIFRMLGGKDAQAIVPEGGETRIELVVKSDPRSDEERLLGTDSSREGYGKTPIVRDAEGRAPPPREVVISGLPEMPGTAVRLGSAALVPRIYWRFEAKNGEARFPVVAAGEWKVTVVEPGKPAVSMPLRVEAGDGPVRAAFVAK
jgi:hypothetical protein